MVVRLKSKHCAEKLCNVTALTFDSYMINYADSKPEFEVVWFDEARLTHGGDWLWVTYLTNCSHIYIVGDEAQIPYVERTQYVTKYAVPDIFDSKPVALSKSYRCPIDIVHWINSTVNDRGKSMYPFTVSTASEVLHSVSTHSITSLSSVPILPDAQYLVYTQDEVTEMKNAGYDNVRTVHQYQGNQNKSIILVRLDKKDAKPIFYRKAYMLVAFSRHTVSLAYYTVLTSKDPVLMELNRIMSYSDGVLRKRGGGEILDTACRTISIKKSFTKLVYLYPPLIRKLNDAYGFGSFIPTRIVTAYKPLNISNHPVLLSDSISNPLNILQEFNDEFLYEPNTVDFDHQLYADSDKSFVGEFSYVPILEKPVRTVYATPRLNTALRGKIPATQSQVLKAFCERNGSVPLLEGDVDETHMASILFNTVLNVCNPGVLEALRTEPLTMNANSLMRWIAKQPETIRNQIMNDPEDFWDKDLTMYSFTIKGNAKPDLDSYPGSRYKSSQTIAYQDKLINSFFCPIMADFTDRVTAALHDNIILFSRMSVDDYCTAVDRVCPYARFQSFENFYEIDFSKFDKSQDLIALKFEVMLMRHFGFPDELLNCWIMMHKETTLRDVKHKFRAKVLYQRKSGDAGTWILNTLFQMAVVIHSLGIDRSILNGSVFCTFSGDDSLVFVESENYSRDHVSDTCANLFNLEVKLLRFNTPYFCSKFFIPTPEGLLFVPDVLKTVVKLGRRDLVNVDHASEYFVSFCDNNKVLFNAYNWPLIDHSIKDRYGGFGSYVATYRALCTIMNSKTIFLSLWDYSNTSFFNILPTLEI
uniref:RdRp catalytic domain-containing protein n=1 Tax=Hubei virga-like virus 19 TaxID=1923334 RepID=A0A1L3KJZ8_9VIRU|nr:hypothetical protein [Hubei virga-like virus 19]